MKNIITIVVRLTFSCLLAATIMGITFIFTSNTKKYNEHVKEQQVMYELLGYKQGDKVPKSLTMHTIYRYVLRIDDKQSIGYLVPLGHGKKDGYLLVNIDLGGKLIESKQVNLSEKDAMEAESCTKAVQETLGAAYGVTFVDQTVIVTENGKRCAYLVAGKFQGFKTFISVMLAVDPGFTLTGMEILEHEEDPGLGAEIAQDYFKNQFKGKTFETLKNIDVIKAPIPDDYLQALTGKMSGEEAKKVRDQYKTSGIYALTGATISSRSVSNGVKGIVTKFAYRIGILDKVLAEQHIAVSF